MGFAWGNDSGNGSGGRGERGAVRTAESDFLAGGSGQAGRKGEADLHLLCTITGRYVSVQSLRLAIAGTLDPIPLRGRFLRSPCPAIDALAPSYTAGVLPALRRGCDDVIAPFLVLCCAHFPTPQVNDLRSDVAVLQQSIAAARGTYDRIKAINQEVGWSGLGGGAVILSWPTPPNSGDARGCGAVGIHWCCS